jgi:hypothetical protein
MNRWKLTNELFGNDKDLLILKTLERIEDDEELEHVYELLAHVPRQHLVEYLTTGRSDEDISELIDQKIITATEARVWGDYDR